MLLLFSFIVMRMSGAIAFNPIFGRVNYPQRARAAFILVLSFYCYSYTGGVLRVVPTSFLEYGFLLLKELFMGFCLGFAMDLCFLSLRFATSVIDFSLGLSMAQVFDPQSRAQATVSTGLFYSFLLLYFITMNGHLRFLEILFRSIDQHPFGEVSIRTLLMPKLMIGLFVSSMKMGLELAFPFMGIELMTELALGILMRIIPQINIFLVNFQLKIAVGFILIYFLLVPISDKMNDYIQNAFSTLQKVLALL